MIDENKIAEKQLDIIISLKQISIFFEQDRLKNNSTTLKTQSRESENIGSFHDGSIFQVKGNEELSGIGVD